MKSLSTVTKNWKRLTLNRLKDVVRILNSDPYFASKPSNYYSELFSLSQVDRIISFGSENKPGFKHSEPIWEKLKHLLLDGANIFISKCECGTWFIKFRSIDKFCSLKCNKANYRRRHKKQYNSYMRNYRKEKRNA